MFKIAGHVWSTSRLTTLHGRQIKVPRFILRTREKQLSLFSFLTFPVKQNFPLYFFTNKKKHQEKVSNFHNHNSATSIIVSEGHLNLNH